MSSPRFLAFIPFIFEWEGETFENDPSDPGGATKFGIDQRSHPAVNIRGLTESQAIDIYWQEWIANGCEMMPPLYGEVFFNCAVNAGRGRATRIDKQVPGESWGQFIDLQDSFYRDLAGRRPGMNRFLHGWLNRTGALREWCAQRTT